MKLTITYVDESEEDVDDCIKIQWLENRECYLITCIDKNYQLDVHCVRKIEVKE